MNLSRHLPSARDLWRPLACLALFAALSAGPVSAEVTLPTIISDGMVLQRNQPVPLWGWDEPGTEVTVKVAGQEAKATADAQGKWMVRLSALEAGGPHTVTISGSNEVTLKDVLVGEVWFCSGQSNMEWPVNRSNNPEKEIADANFAKIRHIKIPHTPAAEPQANVASSGWLPATSENVANFTAVGYYFGRNLHQELDVPIGLIGCNWGGTRIEPWTPPVGFKSVPALESIASQLGQFPSKNNAGNINHQSPLALYNGMVHPLVPYGIRGAIWYQGESNNGEGMLYHEKMKALIKGWREVWGNPDLPFYFVQLAPFGYGGDPTRLPGIWEAQLATLTVPNTGMAVTVDIGNVKDIHPRNKQDVGKRLALWALAKTYDKSGIVYSGPLYKSVEFKDGKAHLAFDHVGSGLVARDGKPLTHFTIAGADGEFVEAEAKIDGDQVVVWSDKVSDPKAVRYAWHQAAEPNLSNKDGLPASPFRTDGAAQ